MKHSQKDDRYTPREGLQGDTSAIPTTKEAQEGNYTNSLDGEVSRSHLNPDAGFKPMGNISNYTKSDGKKLC